MPSRARAPWLIAFAVALLAATIPGTAHADEQSDKLFDALLHPVETGEGAEDADSPASDPWAVAAGGTVSVPLPRYMAVTSQVAGKRRTRAMPSGPAVELGRASYDGQVVGRALAVRLTMVVTLRGEGLKAVPLVGDDAVIDTATVAGAPIGLVRRPGYHVWLTTGQGRFDVEVTLLVPARGPRGSIEYAFRTARTPATDVRIRLAQKGLAPRFDHAVRTAVRTMAGGTEVQASLAPTTRIRLVGFRDVGADEASHAKVYAESASLLSVDESGYELFAVLRYAILHGATRSFEVLVPSGLEVLAADGEGAFRYEIERRGDATLIRGETAYPIQHHYELSLRLRQVASGAESLSVPWPRCVGVEKQYGWLAVEAPGRLRLSEATREDAIAVDVRQLPQDLVDSAVSPILAAYRYHRSDPQLALAVERLPDQPLATAIIDEVRATTVLSDQGKLLTQLRITLRNRWRHSLALELPEAWEVRTALLDGEPIKPSRGEDGVLLPLRRSRGKDRPEPFTLEVVLESHQDAMGRAGLRGLALPALELPVATLHWQLHLPAGHRYGALRSAVQEQVLVGMASWHKPAHDRRAVRWNEASVGDQAEPTSAVSGALPIRVELPRGGVVIEYQRHWVAAGEPVAVVVPYLRTWLALPLLLLLVVVLAIAIVLLPQWRRPDWRPRLVAGGALVIGLASMWALLEHDGPATIAAGLGLALAWWTVRRVRWRRQARYLRVVALRMPRGFRRWRRQRDWSPLRVVASSALVICAVAVAALLGGQLSALAGLLVEPWSEVLPRGE